MQEDQLLPAEAEETIQKYYERLSIWSTKAAVLETQRKMTLDLLRIEEAAKQGRTQLTDLPKIELAKRDGKPETFHAFWQRIKTQVVDRTDLDDERIQGGKLEDGMCLVTADDLNEDAEEEANRAAEWVDQQLKQIVEKWTSKIIG
ncbi:hypothetical protein BLOT_005953 [Blomia tropicalis]|nr:hypothetical protein BLOT_005953 [Blomia tropicalis]